MFIDTQISHIPRSTSSMEVTARFSMIITFAARLRIMFQWGQKSMSLLVNLVLRRLSEEAGLSSAELKPLLLDSMTLLWTIVPQLQAEKRPPLTLVWTLLLMTMPTQGYYSTDEWYHSDNEWTPYCVPG